jgi:menaquinone-dependent protoporphyrinogen oxidase
LPALCRAWWLQEVRNMRVLVAYATHYGATQGIAECVADTLRREDVEVTLADIEHLDRVDPSFDAFVIGSAVHAGRWLKHGTEFVKRNADALRARQVWLFSSGPIGDAVEKPQPKPREIDRFEELVGQRDHVIFGGAFDREVADARGGRFDRAINRFIPEGDYRDWPEIERWATSIAAALREPVAV